MASKKISELPAAGTLSGTEELVIVQGGTTYKTTISDISNALDLSAVSQDIIPDVDNTRSLGSATHMWQDVFIGPGSLYVNGQKVIEESSGTIVLSADDDQNIQVKSQGSGDIEFLPDGTGIIQMKGTLSLQAGNNLTSSDANPIQVQVGFNMNGESITGLAAPASNNDAATKQYVDNGIAAAASNYEPADATILKDADIGSTIQAFSTILQNTTASYTSAEETKLAGLEAGGAGDVWVEKAGDTMNSAANLIFTGGGEVSGLPTTPSGATSATSKAYVDALVSSSVVWQDPVAQPDLVDIVSSEPSTPIVSGMYIAYGGTYSQTWTGGVSVNEYDMVHWTSDGAGGYHWEVDGNIDGVETRIGVGFNVASVDNEGTLPSGMVKDDIAVYVGATSADPRQIANWDFPHGRAGGVTFAVTSVDASSNFTMAADQSRSMKVGNTFTYAGGSAGNGVYTISNVSGATVTVEEATVVSTGGTAEPEIRDGITVLCNNSDCSHFGQSYLYHNDTDVWVIISGPGTITAGVGLEISGETINANLGAGIKELPSDEIGIDLYDATNGGLILTENGSASSTGTDAKLYIKTDSTLLQNSTAGLRVNPDLVTTSLSTGTFTSIGIDDNATFEMIQVVDNIISVGGLTAASGTVINKYVNDGSLTIRSGGSSANSSSLIMYGSTHATLANDVILQANNNPFFEWDESAGSLTISTGTAAKTPMFELSGSILDVGNGGTFSIVHRDGDAAIVLSGGSGSAAGANMVAYGASHTNGGDLLLRNGADVFFKWDESAGNATFYTGTGTKTEALVINSSQQIAVASRCAIGAIASPARELDLYGANNANSSDKAAIRFRDLAGNSMAEITSYRGASSTQGQLHFKTSSSLTTALIIEDNGTLNVSGTTDYETLVTDDDDIPNKKYVDDAVSSGGGGAWEVISSGAIGAVSSITIPFPSDYTELKIVIINAHPSSNNAKLLLRTRENGTVKTLSTYDYTEQSVATAPTYSTNQTAFQITTGAGTDTGDRTNAVIHCHAADVNGISSTWWSYSSYETAFNSAQAATHMWGKRIASPQNGKVDGCQLLWSSGNFVSGNYYLYGIKTAGI